MEGLERPPWVVSRRDDVPTTSLLRATSGLIGQEEIAGFELMLGDDV